MVVFNGEQSYPGKHRTTYSIKNISPNKAVFTKQVLYYPEKMYFHKKHIHPLRKYILPAKKTKQLYSTQKKYIFKKQRNIPKKLYSPKNDIKKLYSQ